MAKQFSMIKEFQKQSQQNVVAEHHGHPVFPQVVPHELRAVRLLSQRDHSSGRCGGYVVRSDERDGRPI